MEFLSKCQLLIFFDSPEAWKKYKNKFGSELKVKEAQWEGKCYVIITNLEKSKINLENLKSDPHVYKIIYQVVRE